jgi:3D (Asp-Asp-Asp) domain-containing protein
MQYVKRFFRNLAIAVSVVGVTIYAGNDIGQVTLNNTMPDRYIVMRSHEPASSVLKPYGDYYTDFQLKPNANNSITEEDIIRRDQITNSSKKPSANAVLTRITFYDCVPDGFCGKTRSGKPVEEGHAACDEKNLGRKFEIVGDPTGRTYLCADTGSAVQGDHVDIFSYYKNAGKEFLKTLKNFYDKYYPELGKKGTYALVEWD